MGIQDRDYYLEDRRRREKRADTRRHRERNTDDIRRLEKSINAAFQSNEVKKTRGGWHNQQASSQPALKQGIQFKQWMVFLSFFVGSVATLLSVLVVLHLSPEMLNSLYRVTGSVLSTIGLLPSNP